MKKYHAVGIAICAAVIITCAISCIVAPVQAVQSDERPHICPTATQDNSGYIVTDEDSDGKPDTVWSCFHIGSPA